MMNPPRPFACLCLLCLLCPTPPPHPLLEKVWEVKEGGPVRLQITCMSSILHPFLVLKINQSIYPSISFPSLGVGSYRNYIYASMYMIYVCVGWLCDVKYDYRAYTFPRFQKSKEKNLFHFLLLRFYVLNLFDASAYGFNVSLSCDFLFVEKNCCKNFLKDLQSV